MGIPEATLSFFLVDDGVDTGELIHQEVVDLEPTDSIEEVSEKLSQIAQVGAFRVGLNITDKGRLVSRPQSANLGSLWRKRTPEDVKIDCRMSGGAILRLVRSFSPPFPMAVLETPAGPFKIHKVELLDWDREVWIMHSLGNVLKVSNDSLIVRVDDEVIKLYTTEKIVGLYAGLDLHPPSSYC